MSKHTPIYYCKTLSDQKGKGLNARGGESVDLRRATTAEGETVTELVLSSQIVEAFICMDTQNKYAQNQSLLSYTVATRVLSVSHLSL